MREIQFVLVLKRGVRGQKGDELFVQVVVDQVLEGLVFAARLSVTASTLAKPLLGERTEMIVMNDSDELV